MGTQECHSRDGMGPLALRDAIPETEWGRWHSGMPFPGRNGAAGAQECHSRDGMGPLALRNAIPGTEWGRWHSGMPFPGRNGAAGMALMLNNKKLMPRYSRLLKKIRVFVAGL